MLGFFFLEKSFRPISDVERDEPRPQTFIHRTTTQAPEPRTSVSGTRESLLSPETENDGIPKFQVCISEGTGTAVLLKGASKVSKDVRLTRTYFLIFFLLAN